MKTSSKRRRSKATIKNEARREDQKQKEIVNKMARIDEMEREMAQMQ